MTQLQTDIARGALLWRTAAYGEMCAERVAERCRLLYEVRGVALPYLNVTDELGGISRMLYRLASTTFLGLVDHEDAYRLGGCAARLFVRLTSALIDQWPT